MTYSDSLVDKRVVKRNVQKGLVDSKELDKQIKALPDQENNAEVVGVDDDMDFDGENEDDGEE